MSVDTAFDQLASDISLTVGGHSTGSHFMPVNCPFCKNKHQTQKKGGFKVEGDMIIYNCFIGSCDATTVYQKGEPVPKKFRALMDEFGVKIPLELITRRKTVKNFVEELDDRFEKNVYKTLTFPKECSNQGITDYWADYLADRLCIYHDLDYRYVTDGQFKGSLAIPHYYFDKLIGWVYITKGGKYITETKSSESMLFIPNRIPPRRPIIVEGHLDALCFPNTVATIGPKVTKKQAYHLRNSNPIVLPDRRGSKLYESAKEYGWDVCIPMWKEKDLNEAVINKGILVAAHMIHNGVMRVSGKSEILYKRWINLK